MKGLLDGLSRFGKTALDLFYPRQCEFCGTVNGCDHFAFLCETCFQEAKLIHAPCCQICGLPVEGRVDSIFECSNCSGIQLHFDRAMAVMRFSGVVRAGIHALKYSRQRYWSGVLNRWFCEYSRPLMDQIQVDVAFPVPLHPVRERERGFNQAWILLDAFSRYWNIPSERRGLSRIRQTETQTHLDRQERFVNLHGAFQVNHPEQVAGKKVLLVDDVLTTGSTASECAHVLRKAGATSVLVFTLARG